MIFGAILFFMVVVRNVTEICLMQCGNLKDLKVHTKSPATYFLIITLSLPFAVSFLELNAYFGYDINIKVRI